MEGKILFSRLVPKDETRKKNGTPIAIGGGSKVVLNDKFLLLIIETILKKRHTIVTKSTRVVLTEI
jgi:hypothetical protein